MKHALLEYQVALFLALFVPSFLLLRRLDRRSSATLRQLLMLCGAISTIVFVSLCVLNLNRSGFLWHDEASILSVAAAYLHGAPMYHGRMADALYSLLYGPSTFLLFTPVLRYSSHPIAAIRALGLVLNLANLALLYIALKTRISRSTALALLPLATAYLLFPVNHLFGVRGDPALLLCFTLGLICVDRLRMLPAALACGVCCGLALDFKLTIAPVVCLLLALLFRRYGWKATLLSSATAIATAASLFLLPNISFTNYLAWLTLSSRQGLLRELFIGNVLAVAFLLAPGLILRIGALQRHASEHLSRQSHNSSQAIRIVFIAALCSSILTGSKDGAGPWHLWPMLPFILMWTAIVAVRCGVDGSGNMAATSRALHLTTAIAIAATAVTLRQGFRDLPIVHASNAAIKRSAEGIAAQELAALLKRYPDRNLAMGYGADAGDWRSSERFLLAMHGENYFLDEGALVESIKAGNPVAPSLVQRVLGCSDVWLIPHGDAPFSTLRTGFSPTRRPASSSRTQSGCTLRRATFA